MNEETKVLIGTIFAWTGPAFIVTFLVFWIGLGHNYPPPNIMGITGQELVDTYYAAFQNDIKIGMALSTVVAYLYLVWSCLLAGMMHESEGGMTVFSFLELSGGALTAWLLGMCPAIWVVCATFATAIDPDIIFALHASSWFIFDMTYMVTTLQVTGLGLFTILNKKQTMFPDWAGWCAIAVGATFIPLTLIPFVSEGPFRLPGLWNFWIVFSVWGFAFFAPYSYFMIREMGVRRRKLMVGEARLA